MTQPFQMETPMNMENSQFNFRKQFLKSRRPERFSDSITREVGKLDRSVLEFQISTLNRRNLELAFENFAKKLCEKVICPNLLEQTGPVAGGDGKVDTQTFPVSGQNKVLWYVGLNDNSESERWAFAVSTQEDWKEKCKKDVRKIHATGRGYKKAFCITNQFAKSNQRSELEDSLKAETGIDVRILDISWILDQIFTNGYEQLAIDTLSIDTEWRREVEVGASDYAKKLRYNEIQTEIKSTFDPNNILADQVDLLLECAVLSKELEHPPIETQGMFDRAIKASNKFGNIYHSFRAHYQYAWAAYWWYEDMAIFEEQLHHCIRYAEEIEQAGQWGDVVTLFFLYSSFFRNKPEKFQQDAVPIQSKIKNSLTILAEKDYRPSNALMCEAYIELLNLQDAQDVTQASATLLTLLDIVKRGEPLLGFSFYELHELMTELDSVFGELSAYEELLDYFTEQSTKRDGDKNSALLWLKRGAHRLDSKKPYQAIKLIGKSLVGLYKKESKSDLYAALTLLSSAYDMVGLLWASRAVLLLAASIATDEFWKSGNPFVAQVYTYLRLTRLELRLGRLNYAISFLNLAQLIDASLTESVISEKEFDNIDGFLSQCILNLDLRNAAPLTKLPDIFDRHGLFVSRSMLLYVLGHEGLVETEYELKLDQDFIEYLLMVRDIDLEVPVAKIKLCDERYTSISSMILGCKIIISFPFKTPFVELAESIISVIEGFFSTCIYNKSYVFESQLNINLTSDDEDDISISHEVDDTGTILKFEILCSSFTSDMLNIAGQRKIQEWFQKFIIDVFAHIIRSSDFDTTLQNMINEDKALERSISFGVCFLSLKNMMGDDAVSEIKSLLADKGLTDYSLLRTRNWDNEYPKQLEKPKYLDNHQIGDGDPPKRIFDRENLTHGEIQVQSLIKPRLWDKAAWRGTGFSYGGEHLPEMILIFKNRAGANSLFENLTNEVGPEDKLNRLKISIIRNFDVRSPSHYRVMISENLLVDNAKLLQMMSRINTMTPTTADNLLNFLESFNTHKQFLLRCATQEKESENPRVLKSAIIKANIHVMDAWQVGPNSIERACLKNDDEPMIPEGVIDIPFNRINKQELK